MAVGYEEGQRSFHGLTVGPESNVGMVVLFGKVGKAGPLKALFR